jgi:hypothetical protein
LRIALRRLVCYYKREYDLLSYKPEKKPVFYEFRLTKGAAMFRKALLVGLVLIASSSWAATRTVLVEHFGWPS